MDLLSEPEFLSTQIIEGPFDVHPTKDAIIVHYSVDAQVLSENMETMGTDLKYCKKIINISGLCASTDISSLAQHLVSQINLIQPIRLPEVEQLLAYLLKRKSSKTKLQDDSNILGLPTKGINQQLENHQKDISEVASLMDLAEYLELLYEDLPDKIRGTSLILQLARNPDNLLELSSNESIFLTLTRVLRDDWRKSIELSSNVIYIFFCFSTFSYFHHLLIHHKVGSLCMSILDHEIERENGKKRGFDNSKKKISSLNKHETLMRVCIYLLLNLAESPSIELKMKNKGIISTLIKLLSWKINELTILVVSFLKKLSIYRENKDIMLSEKILERLIHLIPNENEILLNVIIRLLLNLSFDPVVRKQLITLGYLPKLAALLTNETHCVFVLFVLYHISTDEKGRAAFVYTDCIPIVMKMLLEPEETPDPEVLALCINLACHPDNASLMCHGAGLKLLMNKALALSDPLLMKVVRNLSQHSEEIKQKFLDFLKPLSEVVIKSEDDELILEALGILGNLYIPNMDYQKVITELKLLPSLLSMLKNPATSDDLLLEIIIVCGTFCTDSQCATLMIDNGLPQLLMDILKEKQNDDEIILQIIYCIYQCLRHPATCQSLMKTEVPDYLIELINDKNKQISKLCEEILNIMSEHDPKFSESVKGENFCHYNQQWLEMLMRDMIFDERDIADEEYTMDPYYVHMAAELYNSENFYDLEGSDPKNLTSKAFYASPIGDFDDDSLAAYGVHSLQSPPVDSDMFLYGGGSLYDPIIMGEVSDYAFHPAFAMDQREQLTDARLHGGPARPPSRLNF